MKQTAVKKLKSTRGSGIAEALVGFLISVLSVMALLGVATTTLELIKQGDESIKVLYDEEGAMDEFVNGGESDDDLEGFGVLYRNVSGSPQYRIGAKGVIYVGVIEEAGNYQEAQIRRVTRYAFVDYYATNHHHLFGFTPYQQTN